MRPVDMIVVHCSATRNGDTLFRGGLGQPDYQSPVDVIDLWHRQRGFRRAYSWRVHCNPNLAAIGYHFVIHTNGDIATGRHLGEIGAHAMGHNADSIGICMLGTDKFSAVQFEALAVLVRSLRAAMPSITRVVGHRDLSPDLDGDGVIAPHEWLKTCPGFDVSAWLAADMAVPANHLLTPLEASK